MTDTLVGDDEDGFPGTWGEAASIEEDMLRAVEKAFKIKQELAGSAKGMLADYLRQVRHEATAAAIEILQVHPDNSARVFQLQKTVVPYAHLMNWIRDMQDAGAAAEDNDEREMEE